MTALCFWKVVWCVHAAHDLEAPLSLSPSQGFFAASLRIPVPRPRERYSPASSHCLPGCLSAGQHFPGPQGLNSWGEGGIRSVELRPQGAAGSQTSIFGVLDRSSTSYSPNTPAQQRRGNTAARSCPSGSDLSSHGCCAGSGTSSQLQLTTAPQRRWRFETLLHT